MNQMRQLAQRFPMYEVVAVSIVLAWWAIELITHLLGYGMSVPHLLGGAALQICLIAAGYLYAPRLRRGFASATLLLLVMVTITKLFVILALILL